MFLLLLSLAHGGYGDAVDGIPTYIEREVHLWTNSVRSDPAGFELDYPCGTGAFSPDQLTPKMPLYWHGSLGEAARVHSDDMYVNDFFSHNSSDGTSSGNRVSQYYAHPSGENIAVGYPSAWAAVLDGWMCSSGHRANIMNSDYNDFGAGVVSQYYTQNFGIRPFTEDAYAARTGMHFPQWPNATAEYRVSVYTVDGPPAEVRVVANGVPHALEVLHGAPDNGVYSADLDVDQTWSCTAYWFEVETASGRVDQFPAEGAYGFGDCPWTDADARWITRDAVPALADLDTALPDTEEPGGCGCTHSPQPLAGWVVGLFGAMLLRRRL